MKCPFCGTDNPAGEMFCGNCGGSLDPTTAPPTVVTGGGTATVVSNASTTGSTTATSPTSGASSGTLTPNSRLQNGRYVVEKILGQGGMGAAVLAKDTRVSNKRVVIKELISDNADPTQRQEDVRNFVREVDTLANLDHPLIPTVTDSFQEGSHYFMVQEYAPGENLEAHMERLKQPMPEQEALSYTSQVLDILDYLSQQHPPIVHRDIKPANIIISSRDKRARLVDFGIARADVTKNAQRKQTSALGTPGYAPPEQYQGNADTRSDMYALSATLHHLLTNRDPRDYPPFSYPAVRTLNSRITSDTERVLKKALEINANNRYQTPAELKQEIDTILAQHFSTGPDTSTYMRGTSGPISSPGLPPTPIQRPVTPPPPVKQPVQAQRQQQTMQPPPQQIQPRRQSNGAALSFIILVVVVVLIGGILFVPNLLKSNSQGGTQGGNQGGFPTAVSSETVTPVNTSNGIGVTTTSTNESIGISDGTFAFDTNRNDGSDKKDAADNLKAGNIGSAQSSLRSALVKETNDAEAAIYLENLRIGSRPHITIIVATMLTGSGDLISVGRDNLQGAYVAQKEFNDKAGASGMQVKLLIANTGSSSNYATAVAQQIVQAAKSDNTVVGVTGWPYSSRALNAIPVLTQAQIVSVSSTASSDDLTGTSPYFFRVAPSDTTQAGAGAKYAQQKLQAKNVVVFEDTSDPYSRSLGEGFKKQFTGTILATVNYKVNDKKSVTTALQEAMSQNPKPDLFYFAGYPNDVSVILEDTASAKVPVLGGDALYNLGGYTKASTTGFSRLHFTEFAYPDEWDVLKLGSQKPPFYTDYGKAFDPNKKHANAYGYTRAAYNVTLSYDSTLAMLSAANNVLSSNGGKLFTSADLQKALTNIKGAQAIQGASGQIAFDANGDPVDKAVVILSVGSGGFKMEDGLAAGKLVK